MALAFLGLGEFILAQNIFAQLHVGPANIFEERFDVLLVLHYVIGQIVYIDIDADRADDSELLPINRDGRALKFS